MQLPARLITTTNGDARVVLEYQSSVRSIADHLAIGDNEAAGPPLAHLQHATQMSDSISLGSGPYHFFARSSFSAALSSIDSANSFFSLRFSSSSIRSRLASDTSMPPYLLFQLYRVASEIPCLRAKSAVFRSEEHTSELQSQSN